MFAIATSVISLDTESLSASSFELLDEVCSDIPMFDCLTVVSIFSTASDAGVMFDCLTVANDAMIF